MTDSSSMAGVGGDKVIDPVALLRKPPARRARAARARREPSTEPPVSLEVQPDAPTNVEGFELAAPVEFDGAPPPPLPVMGAPEAAVSQARPQACLTCERPLPADARFCPSCGESTSLPQDVQPSAPVMGARPKPEALLSEAERAERQRLHQLAVVAGQREPQMRYQRAEPGRKAILIHILEDGFTAFGTVWFRGQELEVEIDGPRWEEARRWILWDDFAQMDIYKKVNFRHGPWPGVRTYTAGQGRFQPLRAGTKGGPRVGNDNAPLIPLPDAQVLSQADLMEQRRGRAVPLPTMA